MIDEEEMMAFENRMLSKIVQSKRGELTTIKTK
jgi:hypothetical protein